MGLWLAGIITPPTAFSFISAMVKVGVGTMPRSVTLHPQSVRVLMTAFAIALPEGRPSRPTTIFPLYLPANAAAYRAAISAVSSSVVKRIPERLGMIIYSDAIMTFIFLKWGKLIGS